MITLEDYIKDNIHEKYLYDRGLKMFDYKNKPYYIQAYTENDHLIEYYKQFIQDYNTNNIIDIKNNNIDTFYNIINENLQSHNVDKMITKLKSLYKDFNYVKFDNTVNHNNIHSLQVQYNNIDKLKEFYNDKNVHNILNFFNYKIDTPIYRIAVHNCINIEPTYPENVTDNIFTKSNGILYHIIKLDHAKQVESSGLRCKPSKHSVRLYPKRIYCFTLNNNNIYNKDNSELLKNIYKRLELKPAFTRIYKINLNKSSQQCLNIDFYKDEFMMDLADNCVFTYHNIPKDLITDITSEKLVDYLIKTV